jgi:hypothetical protein
LLELNGRAVFNKKAFGEHREATVRRSLNDQDQLERAFADPTRESRRAAAD